MLKKLTEFLKLLHNDQRGITLTELLITSSIMTTVALITPSQYDKVLGSARDASRLNNLQQTQTASNIYYLDHETYPVCGTNEQATAACYEQLKGALEPDYMPEIPQDPLNQKDAASGVDYTYKYYSDGQKGWIEFETEDPADASPRKLWLLGS